MRDGSTLTGDVWKRPDGTITRGEITEGSGSRLHRAGQTISRERALELGIASPVVEETIETKDPLDSMSYRELQIEAKRVEVAADGARDVLVKRIRSRLAS